MTRLLIPLILLFLLAACASTPATPPEPIVQTIEVKVPVPVDCQGEIGPVPVYADSPEALAAAADIFEAIKLRIAGRGQRIDRERELMAARCQA